MRSSGNINQSSNQNYSAVSFVKSQRSDIRKGNSYILTSLLIDYKEIVRPSTGS
jgi:hypothetical protein